MPSAMVSAVGRDALAAGLGGDLELLDPVAGAPRRRRSRPSRASVSLPSMPWMMTLSSARGLVVGPGGLGLVLGDLAGLEPRLGDVAERDLDEAVVGAGLLAGAGDVERRRRGARWSSPAPSASACGVGPVVEALGLRADEGVEVGEAEALDGVVGRVGQHRDAVEGDLQLDELDAGLLAGGDLLLA